MTCLTANYGVITPCKRAACTTPYAKKMETETETATETETDREGEREGWSTTPYAKNKAQAHSNEDDC